MHPFIAKVGIVIAAVGVAAYLTGPGGPMKQPINGLIGGADALAVALGGGAIWFLAR